MIRAAMRLAASENRGADYERLKAIAKALEAAQKR